MNGVWGISYEVALRWMPLDLTDDKSALDQAIAWCRQATGHYLSPCWPRSMSPYDVTRPQWVMWDNPLFQWRHVYVFVLLRVVAIQNPVLPVQQSSISRPSYRHTPYTKKDRLYWTGTQVKAMTNAAFVANIRCILDKLTNTMERILQYHLQSRNS